MTQRALPKSRLWLILATLIALGLVIAPALIDQAVRATQNLLRRPTSFTESLEFTNPNAFAFDVSQISVDSRGASLISPNSQSDVILLDRIEIPNDTRLVSFSESAASVALSNFGIVFLSHCSAI